MSTNETPAAVEATIAIDLTMLGVVSGEAYETLGADLPVEYANYPQLASCAHAAARGGVDFISLSMDFHARSDAPHSLDGARVAARLLSQEAGHVTVEISSDPELAFPALDVVGTGRNSAGVYVSLSEGDCVETLRPIAAAARAQGFLFDVAVEAADVDDARLEVIAELADRVRLVTPNPHEAARVRERLRERTQVNGRDISIFGELGIVISGSPMAANERALLVEAMSGEPLFADKASVVGTVYDVADAIERWVGLGAVDGMVMLPASLPTDLASLIRGVIPLLKARAGEVSQ